MKEYFQKHRFGAPFLEIGENKSADWIKLLAGFSLFVIVMVSLSVSVYYGEELPGVSATTTPAIISENNINRIITHYENRRAQIDKGSIPLIVDPSL